MSTQIRTRFAPSPTGYLHIGSLRTALFNFLLARKENGSAILRVEDTDQNRLVEGAVEGLLQTLQNLGIEFDEGPFLTDAGAIKERGEYGPYTQSERLEKYQNAVRQLIDNNKAYYCFCDAQRLDELRKEQVALKKPPMYDGQCRELNGEEIEKKVKQLAEEGRKPVVRQAIPKDGVTEVSDLVYGKMKFENRVLDDQVLLKSDGFPTYHLAVVVDDHDMKISHVIRGEEWIPSTPKHILLYQAFGWEPTQFAHLPLILNQDKSKLSKRQGDVAVEDFLQKGYLKQALINFVAFLGWNPKTEQEIFSLDELVKQFDISKVNKSGAVFDINKLDWINGKYIREMSVEKLTSYLIPEWERSEMIKSDNGKWISELGTVDEGFLHKVTAMEQERLKKFSEISERTGYCFSRPKLEKEKIVWKKSNPEDTKKVLTGLKQLIESLSEADFLAVQVESSIKKFIEDEAYDNGTVLWPLRYSMTGMERSPGPFEVVSALLEGYGRQEVVDRLENSANLL